MFFCRADKRNCLALKTILSRYEKASGQQINALKSSITFSSKTPTHIRNSCKQILGINLEGGVGKYLGLPENFGRKKKDVFASILDRIKQKVVSWSTKFLSGAGRLVLLKAVLSALPIYTMSCFKLPVSLCKRIQSLLTRFWWDGCSEKKKMSWVAWRKMAKPKVLGGLGFKDIQHFNDALLGKIAWRIVRNPDSLLARLLLKKYCKDTDFLSCSAPSVASHGWRGILIGRDIINRQLRYAVGDGKNIKVWKDNWLPIPTSPCPIGPPCPHTEDMNVEELLTHDGTEWDEHRLDRFFPRIKDVIKALS